jgi:hypothetical protein
MRLIFQVLVACLLVGCWSEPIQEGREATSRAHHVDYGISSPYPADYGDTFDWQHETPAQFLNVLRKGAKWPTPIYTVHGIHYGWIHEQDIPFLISQLDSSEPCASVLMSISSYLFPCSTVGNEAAFLIVGFRAGHYPPDLNSNRPAYDKGDKERLRNWWIHHVISAPAGLIIPPRPPDPWRGHPDGKP